MEQGSIQNLDDLFAQSDPMDRDDGRRAYLRYHDLMHDIALAYDAPFEATVAVFCALSPNNDYVGNLRSLVSMLAARRACVDPMYATVSTYKHCQRRACRYLQGVPFLDEAKGLKIRAFYENIVDPTAWAPVTVDGHMVCAWLGKDMTMSDAAKVTNKTLYRTIAQAIRDLASDHDMLPQQMQATLWFARKRIKGLKYSAQLDLLDLDAGAQKTTFRVDEIRPYRMNKIAADDRSSAA